MLNLSSKSKFILVVFIGLGGVSAVQGASISDVKLSVGPRLFYTQPKDADSSATSYGAQMRFNLTGNLKVEGSIDSRSNEYLAGLAKVTVYPVQGTVLAYLNPDATMSPYLLGGVGMYYTKTEVPLINYDNTANRFGFHVGAGLEIMLSDRLSFDGSVRYLSIEKISSKNVDLTDKQYDDSGTLVTLGLNFIF